MLFRVFWGWPGLRRLKGPDTRLSRAIETGLQTFKLMSLVGMTFGVGNACHLIHNFCIDEGGVCNALVTRRFPTTSSSISRRLILERPIESLPMAIAPMAKAPIAIAPTANAPTTAPPNLSFLK